MVRDTARLGEALRDLRDALVSLPAAAGSEGWDDADRTRLQLIDQIDDYLLPRLRNIEAPLLVGIGGSTGAGKSTITNSLVGETMTETGLLRPTTRTPVLVCHPDDERWFGEGGVLPDLPRTTGRPPTDGSALAIRTSGRMRQGLAILDTPDIDSVEIANHELASQLLGAADLWLFVTTAARYADAVPWEYLRTARERSTALAIGINRIPPGATDTVIAHFREMLAEQDLADVMLFPIEERQLADDRLPADAIGGLATWLADLATDAERRTEVVRGTIAGAVASIPMRIDAIAAGIIRSSEATAALALVTDRRHEEAVDRVSARLDGGTLLRGEVIARWQEFVGSGQLMQSIQASVARLRDRLRSVLTGTQTTPAELQGELESSLLIAVTEAVDEAADATVAAWESSPPGPVLMGDEARRLSRPSTQFEGRARREIEAWQDFVLALVGHQAEDKRLVARTLSLGINTIGVSLMVVIFAQTGGLTGGEVAVAGGTATLSQALLTAIFGESAVRELAGQARDDLMARIQRLLALEAERFHVLLDGAPTMRDADHLVEVAAAVQEAAK